MYRCVGNTHVHVDFSPDSPTALTYAQSMDAIAMTLAGEAAEELLEEFGAELPQQHDPRGRQNVETVLGRCLPRLSAARRAKLVAREHGRARAMVRRDLARVIAVGNVLLALSNEEARHGAPWSVSLEGDRLAEVLRFVAIQ